MKNETPALKRLKQTINLRYFRPTIKKPHQNHIPPQPYIKPLHKNNTTTPKRPHMTSSSAPPPTPLTPLTPSLAGDWPVAMAGRSARASQRGPVSSGACGRGAQKAPAAVPSNISAVAVMEYYYAIVATVSGLSMVLYWNTLVADFAYDDR